MRDCLLTLDVGTSTIKAIVWKKDGSCLYFAKVLSPPLIYQNEFVEQAIACFERQIKKLLHTVMQSEYSHRIVLFAITTQRNTLMAMDEHVYLTRLISWLDNRGSTINGTRLDWLCEKFPAFSKMNRLRSLMSWLCEKITGLPYETASTMPQEWLQSQRDEIKLLDCPIPKPIGTILAASPTDAEFKSFVPMGLPIMIGPGDKDCALLGGQAYLRDQGVLCCGTAISLGKLVPEKPAKAAANIYLSPSEFEHCYPIETGIADKRILHNASSKAFVSLFMQCKKRLEEQGVHINRLLLGGNDESIISRATELANALSCDIELVKNSELTSCGLAAIGIKAMDDVDSLFDAVQIFRPKESIMIPWLSF